MYQNIIFVNEEEAKSYMLPPNSKMLLMDSDRPIFYIKTTDSLGRTSSFESYAFESIPQPQPLTKSDLDTFKEEILALIQHKEDSSNNGKSTTNEW